MVLDPGVDVGERPDRPGQLADGHPVAGRPQPLHVAVGLQRPQGELGAEGGRLGVHPVGPAGDRHVDGLERPGLQAGTSPSAASMSRSAAR